MCMTLLVGSAIAGIGGTAYNVDRSREAQKDNERAARIEKRKAAIQNARERRRAAAESQVMRSRIQASQAAGGFSSTGQDTAMGAINAQLGGNLSFAAKTESMNNSILSAQQSAAANQTRAAYGDAVSGLFSSVGMGLGSQIKSNLASGGSWWKAATPLTTNSSFIPNTGFGGMGAPVSPFLQGSSSVSIVG